MSEIKDLELNGIYPNSFAKTLYDGFKDNGSSHKDAVKKVIDVVNNGQYSGLTEVDVKMIKNAFFHVPGSFYDEENED